MDYKKAIHFFRNHFDSGLNRLSIHRVTHPDTLARVFPIGIFRQPKEKVLARNDQNPAVFQALVKLLCRDGKALKPKPEK